MGCWNGTCMISNLPIMSGDKIKLVILRNSIGATRLTNSSGYVYSNDIFNPSFFAISGEYNDYGMIEGVVEDWNYKLIEDYFKKLFGDKIMADGKEITEYTLIDILDGIERHDLKYFGKPTREDLRRQSMAIEACKVYGEHGFSSEKIEKEWKDLANMNTDETWRIANFSFVMIREDIWNHIADNYKGEFYNREAKGVDDKDFYLTARQYCQKEFEKGLLQATKLKSLLNRTENNISAIEELKDLLTSGFVMNVFNRQNLDFIAPELYDTIAVDGDKDTREDILKRYTEFTCISSFISETRKGWMIQPGAGSQHDGWDMHLLLAKKIVEVCEKEISNMDE